MKLEERERPLRHHWFMKAARPPHRASRSDLFAYIVVGTIVTGTITALIFMGAL